MSSAAVSPFDYRKLWADKDPSWELVSDVYGTVIAKSDTAVNAVHAAEDFLGLLRRARSRPPPASHAIRLDDDVDHATAALVKSSIPAYRNSEYCAKCGAQRVFIKMDFVCREHG